MAASGETLADFDRLYCLGSHRLAISAYPDRLSLVWAGYQNQRLILDYSDRLYCFGSALDIAAIEPALSRQLSVKLKSRPERLPVAESFVNRFRQM